MDSGAFSVGNGPPMIREERAGASAPDKYDAHRRGARRPSSAEHQQQQPNAYWLEEAMMGAPLAGSSSPQMKRGELYSTPLPFNNSPSGPRLAYPASYQEVSPMMYSPSPQPQQQQYLNVGFSGLSSASLTRQRSHSDSSTMASSSRQGYDHHRNYSHQLPIKQEQQYVSLSGGNSPSRLSPYGSSVVTSPSSASPSYASHSSSNSPSRLSPYGTSASARPSSASSSYASHSSNNSPSRGALLGPPPPSALTWQSPQGPGHAGTYGTSTMAEPSGYVDPALTLSGYSPPPRATDNAGAVAGPSRVTRPMADYSTSDRASAAVPVGAYSPGRSGNSPLPGNSASSERERSGGHHRTVGATPAMRAASGSRRKNEATYVCDICQDSFTTGHSLKRHKDAHAGIRYKCSLCDASYGTKSDCRNHMKKHGETNLDPVTIIVPVQAQADVER